MNVARVLETKGSTSVVTIPGTATLQQFVELACEKGVGAMLVMDDRGTMTGILSERDILRQCSARANFDLVKVCDVMTREVASVHPKEDINKVIDLMVTRSVRHLPVMADGKILGLITVRDVIRSLRNAESDDIRYLIQYLQDSMEKEDVSL